MGGKSQLCVLNSVTWVWWHLLRSIIMCHMHTFPLWQRGLYSTNFLLLDQVRKMLCYATFWSESRYLSTVFIETIDKCPARLSVGMMLFEWQFDAQTSCCTFSLIWLITKFSCQQGDFKGEWRLLGASALCHSFWIQSFILNALYICIEVPPWTLLPPNEECLPA